MCESPRPVVVIKVGTSSLVDASSGRVQVAALARVAEATTRLQGAGFAVIIVSSGAVGLGCVRLGLKERPTSISGKQAAAAVGQQKLMGLYDDLFSVLGHTVAQVLLTYDTLGERVQYLNARATLHELLRLGAIPIVNENDTVAVAELRVGDNDSLSAHVAALVGASWLFLLTDVDSLCDANPREIPSARAITLVAPPHIQNLRRQMLAGCARLAPELNLDAAIAAAAAEASAAGGGSVTTHSGASAPAAAVAAAPAAVVAVPVVAAVASSVAGSSGTPLRTMSPQRKAGSGAGAAAVASATGGAAGGAAVSGAGSGGAGSAWGTGGMATKLKAAQLATAAGVTVVIMNTNKIELLDATLVGSGGGGCAAAPFGCFAERGIGTTFSPAPRPVTGGRKRWVLSLAPAGTLLLDAGAAAAVGSFKSLFPAGVVGVEGEFEQHDAVALVCAADGREVARALVNYSADECRRVQGRRSRDCLEVLGYLGPEPIADRDNIVVLLPMEVGGGEGATP